MNLNKEYQSLLDYIEAMCYSPDTPSKKKIECIIGMMEDWEKDHKCFLRDIDNIMEKKK